METKWTKLFEFLYDNGFRYIARTEDNPLVAWAYVNKPKLYIGGYCSTYLAPAGDKFKINLNLRCAGTFPVKINSYMKISDLLKREE